MWPTALGQLSLKAARPWFQETLLGQEAQAQRLLQTVPGPQG